MTTIETNTAQQEINPTSWPLQRVGLRVQNLARSIEYYTHLGLSIVRDERDETGNGNVGLGVGAREVLQLRTLAGGKPRPRHSAGLFHFALLVPTEAELGSFLTHSLDRNNKVPLGGASDHRVSKALYLTDPEGNGIEVYYDRPRDQWSYQDGQLQIDTLPLDAQYLIKQSTGTFTGFSDQLRLGHMHLNVGNLEQSYAFYQQIGMKLIMEMGNQAYFMSWDGYHHHLGNNLWAGRNVSPVADDSYGIDFYEVKRPELAPTTLKDPNGITVELI